MSKCVDIFEFNKSINGLQYLRGIAALMVVYHHSLNYFDNTAGFIGIGARGVDIFFVISGFIMAYTTRQNTHSSYFWESIEFLYKRFIRVVPLYWLAIFWTFHPHWIPYVSNFLDFFKTLYWSSMSTMMWKDLIFIPHYSISEKSPNMIAPILTPGWTINYEMFFYFIFGCSIIFGRYKLLVVSLALLMLVAAGHLYQFSNVIYKFYTSNILIEFVFGIIVYVIYQKTHNLSLSRLNYVFFGCCGFLLLYISNHLNLRFVSATAAAMIVWSFIHMFHRSENSFLKLIGDASYSIYLFHIGSFALVESIIKITGIGAESNNSIFVIIVLHMSIAAMVGILIYFTIEKPLLKILRYILMPRLQH